jgi:hypothetical protein
MLGRSREKKDAPETGAPLVVMKRPGYFFSGVVVVVVVDVVVAGVAVSGVAGKVVDGVAGKVVVVVDFSSTTLGASAGGASFFCSPPQATVATMPRERTPRARIETDFFICISLCSLAFD